MDCAVCPSQESLMPPEPPCQSGGRAWPSQRGKEGKNALLEPNLSRESMTHGFQGKKCEPKLWPKVEGTGPSECKRGQGGVDISPAPSPILLLPSRAYLPLENEVTRQYV